MKKTIAVLLLMGSAAAVSAQDTLNSDLNNDPQRIEMTGMYHAKGTTNIPSHLRSNFVLTYPEIADVTWYEMNDNWYRAVHMNEGRTVHTYYAPNGLSYIVALPVLQSWVPEPVVTTAISKYGNNIYAVNKVKVAGDLDAYQVSILEKGTLRYEWIGEDGTAITDVFRSSTDDMANTNLLETSSDNAAKDVKVKTKVEKADGTEIKTKTKNGKTKVKVDD